MSNPRRATLNIHQHDGGGIGPHRDIRLFVENEGGGPTVHHFVSGRALPDDGKLARWSSLRDPHLTDERMEYNGRFGADDSTIRHEATHEASLVEGDDPESGIVHLSVGDKRYAVSISSEGHAYVQAGQPERQEKAAGIFDNQMAQMLIVDRARAMGIIPPDLFNPSGQNPALQSYMDGGGGLMSSIGSAIGAGAKTLSLSFLGGLGAGAGWEYGGRLAGKNKNKKHAEQTPGAVEGAQPADGAKPDLASPAARRTAGMAAGGFGPLPSDPL
jgi:hypothetical protein